MLREEEHEEHNDEFHVMIDTETLSNQWGAPLVTVGAVLFRPRRIETREQLLQRAFLRRINLENAVENSPGGIDAGTISWWFKQEDAAIKALVEGETVATKVALFDLNLYVQARQGELESRFFSGFCKLPPAKIAWAKSPDFDWMCVLNPALRSAKLPPPVHWSAWRCVRTIQDLAWPNGPADRPEFEGVAHDAANDAVNQAMSVQAAYQELGLSLDDKVEYHDRPR